jgi:hypothetical protein
MIIIIANPILPSDDLDLEDELDILSRLRKDLKDDPTALKILKEYNKDIDILDGIPIDISDEIDVSAKTINSRIILNRKLLNEPFEVIMRYLVHELVHALQHTEIKDGKDPYEGYEYLDRPDEIEAFQYQIEFDKNNRGEDHAIEYVEDLLEYHEIPEHEKDEKKDELLERV